MTEFITWDIMATYAGAVAATALIVQFAKNTVDGIIKMPTQLFSYIVALVVLYASYYFTEKLDASSAAMILFNGMIVSLAANGGYEAALKIFKGE